MRDDTAADSPAASDDATDIKTSLYASESPPRKKAGQRRTPRPPARIADTRGRDSVLWTATLSELWPWSGRYEYPGYTRCAAAAFGIATDTARRWRCAASRQPLPTALAERIASYLERRAAVLSSLAAEWRRYAADQPPPRLGRGFRAQRLSEVDGWRSKAR